MKALFLLLLALPVTSLSQSIESNKFDKFDSTYWIISKKEVWTMKMTSSQAIWLRVKKLRIGKSSDSTMIADIIFVPGKVTSLDKSSYVKIEFKDGSIKQYDRFSNSYKLYTSDDFATMTIMIPLDDDLFNKDISSVRVSTSSLMRDYEIKDKKSDLLKNTLILIKGTTFKN